MAVAREVGQAVGKHAQGIIQDSAFCPMGTMLAFTGASFLGIVDHTVAKEGWSGQSTPGG